MLRAERSLGVRGGSVAFAGIVERDVIGVVRLLIISETRRLCIEQPILDEKPRILERLGVGQVAQGVEPERRQERGRSDVGVGRREEVREVRRR